MILIIFRHYKICVNKIINFSVKKNIGVVVGLYFLGVKKNIGVVVGLYFLDKMINF